MENEYWILRNRIHAAINRIKPGSSKNFGAVPGAEARRWLNEFLGVNVENDLILVCLRQFADEAERQANQIASTALIP